MTANRRRSFLAGGSILVLLIVAASYLATRPSEASEADQAVTQPLPTEVIERGDLIEEIETVGDVGYGESWPAAIETAGVITNRHEAGTTVEPGEPLIWINTVPVFLADGSAPMYRTLESVRDAAGEYQSGPDVTQLQEFLLSQGFDDAGRLEATGEFRISTTRAVKAWQKANAMAVTGTVDRSRILFHPSSLRVENSPRAGSSFTELLVTDSAEQVTATFAAAQRTFVPVGATVTLDLGEGETVKGLITDVSSVVADDGARKLKVTVTASQMMPEGVERVTVHASRSAASDVLIVPVRAVLALAGGGYGLEVPTPAGPELRAVELGPVVDDRVEIRGDYAEGDQVVVAIDEVGGS